MDSIVATPETMRAAVVAEFSKTSPAYKFTTVPVPTALKPHQILIKVAVASFCHTDLQILEGGFGETPTLVAGSHEPTGVIVKLGSDVKGFQIGDRIAASGTMGICGTCNDCTVRDADGLKYDQDCDAQEGFVGVFGQCPGAFQEYTIVDYRYSAKLPEKMSFIDAAPLTCAGLTSFRAFKTASLKPGDWLAVVGSGGGLGHLIVQFAVASGVKVIGIDARDEGLDLTRKAGAHTTLDARMGQAKLVEEVNKYVKGGVTRSIMVSDHPTAAPNACAITRRHGTVVVVALPENFVVPTTEIVMRDIRIRGSHIGSAEEMQEMVDFVVDKGIKVETKVFDGLDSLPQVIETYQNAKVAGKLVVIMDKTL